MGCDIHLFAERKNGDKWQMITDEFEQYDKRRGDQLVVGRDYELFAFLADVRNDHDIKPISTPKGVPEDASLRYRAEVEDYGEEGHSHSYFTLAELKALPKELTEQEFEDGSLITGKDENGKVTEVCKWSSRPTMGPVGRRKLFSLWDNHAPIQKIIQMVEEATKFDDLKDDQKRIVFFFDN